MFQENKQPTLSQHSSKGFTLLELLICLVIAGVIASFLLVSVVAARESGRKLQCQNNVRQTMLGLLQVIDRKKQIPVFMTTIPSELPNDDPVGIGLLVLVARELSIPFRAYHNSVRFDSDLLGESYPPPLYNCPSTGDRRLAIRFNLGVDAVHNPSLRHSGHDFLFSWLKSSELLEIMDGLSTTAALAERPAPTEEAVLSRAIAVEYQAESFAEMAGNCRRAYDNGQFYVEPNRSWWTHNVKEGFYDHSRPPNTSEVDCVSTVYEGTSVRPTARFLISARSFHAGGVNVALFDGSIHFVSNQIDLQTWRAIGTHNAGDKSATW